MIISEEELKQILQAHNILTPEKLKTVEEYSRNSQLSLKDALLEKNIVTDENLGVLIADHLKIPFVILSKLSIPPDILRLIPERVARKEQAIPFMRDASGIRIATVNPKNELLLELLTKKTGQRVFLYYATEKDIQNTLATYRKDLQKIFDNLIQKKDTDNEDRVYENAPVAKIVDLLINYAYQDKASDIHVEPQEKNALVRFRIDGILHDVLVMNKNIYERVTSRIKVLSRLRTDEHLSAQDGKMRASLEEENLDIRVSIIPIADGEKIVMRLLSSKSRQFSLIDLGMTEVDLQKVTRSFMKSFGMILSTGPTGSGKSTSIYSILKIINTREKNITTIEDPIEYRIKGVNQIQTNTKANLTFAQGLRSILRQDPNVIFVGEIRDIETAGIAVNASLTGHLVLSTLHTNDAATALPRLTDMKVEPYLVASTVNVILGQRLVRKICDMCRASYSSNTSELVRQIPQETILKHFGQEGEIRLYKGQGCKVCHMTGYSGRIGVFEVLEVSKEIKKLIINKEDSDVIAEQARKEGMTTMLDDGLEKVKKGLTTIDEILRVTKVETT